MPRSALTPPARTATASSRYAGLVLAGLVALTVLLHPGQAIADGSEAHLAARLDGERTSRGLAALTRVGELDVVARQHAAAMASGSGLFHNDALETQVGGWSKLAENIGRGADAERVHLALMASPAHRANLLSTSLTQVGIGTAWGGGELWVVQVFRAPSAGATPVPTPAPAPASVPAPAPALPPLCDGVGSAGFGDIPPAAWFAPAVDCAVAAGLVQGVSAAAFSPESPVTREQMASLLHRVALRSASPPPPAPDLFGDDDGSPHEGAVNALAGLGVLEGTAPGVVSPRAPVTRAQAASLLARLHERLAGPLPGSAVPFVDVATSVHLEAIGQTTAAGLTDGTSATTFTPDAPVRRNGAAVLVVRSLGGLQSAGAAR